MWQRSVTWTTSQNSWDISYSIWELSQISSFFTWRKTWSSLDKTSSCHMCSMFNVYLYIYLLRCLFFYKEDGFFFKCWVLIIDAGYMVTKQKEKMKISGPSDTIKWRIYKMIAPKYDFQARIFRIKISDVGGIDFFFFKILSVILSFGLGFVSSLKNIILLHRKVEQSVNCNTSINCTKGYVDTDLPFLNY